MNNLQNRMSQSQSENRNGSIRCEGKVQLTFEFPIGASGGGFCSQNMGDGERTELIVVMKCRSVIGLCCCTLPRALSDRSEHAATLLAE